MNPSDTVFEERHVTGFATTRWSVVLRAQQAQGSAAEEALDQLCRAYWPALFQYARRTGSSAVEAEDLVQGFFAELFAKDYLRVADRQRGRFRSFLLTCFKHYRSHTVQRARTVRRGGRYAFVSIEAAALGETISAAAAQAISAEELYDRRWATTLLHTALTRLSQEHATTPERRAHFDALKRFLSTEGTNAAYDAIALRLGTSRSAIAVGVHRLRQRLGALVREEAAQTIADPADLDDEMSHLVRLMLL